MRRGALSVALLLGACSPADTFWPETPAPWETVDGFFYPDRNNLTVHTAVHGFATLDACREWAASLAMAINDVGRTESDYECAAGKMDDLGDVAIYRITAR